MVIFSLLIFGSAISMAISQLDTSKDGYCTSIEDRDSLESQIITYLDMETYIGKCPGYYFKRCLQSRNVLKTRMHYDIVKRTQIIRKCCLGYLDYDGDCLPYCMSGCQNGNCTAPNHCTCLEDYEEDDFNRCVPKCIGCKNGECLSPNVCQCHPGYDWDSKARECIPRCTDECHEHSVCTAPNQCECKKGYILASNMPWHICIPRCEPACVNGNCAAPNECLCNENYVAKNGSNICEPICDVECVNGKCIAPNTCECHENYVVHDASQPHDCHCGKYCAEVDGQCHCLDDRQRVKNYARLYGNETATGNCTEVNCVNGFCATLWRCECNFGFEKDESDTCTPQNETCIGETEGDCAPIDTLNATTSEPSHSLALCSCINGICSSHENKCICIGGYRMSNTTADKCVPYCSKDCISGYCNEPDICECFEGYRIGYNDSDWNVCYPVCNEDTEMDGCTNGTCVAPNKCECHIGYDQNPNDTFSCIPSKYDPNSFTMESSSIGTWIGSLLLVVILCSVSAYAFILYRKRSLIYRYRDHQYSTEPIAGDLGEEL